MWSFPSESLDLQPVISQTQLVHLQPTVVSLRSLLVDHHCAPKFFYLGFTNCSALVLFVMW